MLVSDHIYMGRTPNS